MYLIVLLIDVHCHLHGSYRGQNLPGIPWIYGCHEVQVGGQWQVVHIGCYILCDTYLQTP